MEWDKDGELLAVLQEGSSVIKLWVGHPLRPAAAPPPRTAAGACWIAATGVRTPCLCAVQDANQNQDTDLDTSMTNLTLISWSGVGPQLAIGNAKGDLVIYNKQQLKKQLIRGKHTKKITCGAWNSENKLALGSEDRQAQWPRCTVPSSGGTRHKAHGTRHNGERGACLTARAPGPVADHHQQPRRRHVAPEHSQADTG